MNKAHGAQAEIIGETVPIVCISPLAADHDSLKRIVNRSESDGGPKWLLHAASTPNSALTLLRTGDVPIVVCEHDLGSSSWKDVLEDLAVLPNPPLLIVSSRAADERLWAEALNLGAYDVLAKPFDAGEVVRVLRSAWFRKKNEPLRRASAGAAF